MFKRQAVKYSCGTTSLQYALTFLGTTVDEKDLRKAARTTTLGTDEQGIARAAQRYGHVAVMRTFRSFRIAYRHLMRYVQSGQPCILCVDNWKHWLTVAGASRKGAAAFDPGRPGVASLVTTTRLRNRWRYVPGEEDDKPYFFFIAIRPGNGGRRAPRVARGINRETVQELRKRDELRQGWNQYLQDLTDVFSDMNRRPSGTVPAWTFMRRNSELLVELVSFWDGSLPKNF